jgi:hypothetical protein
VHDVPCTVQFVRATSPSTSYAPAAVAVAKNYGWKRVCTLAFQSPDYRATTVAWTNAFSDDFINARNIYVDEQGFRRSGSLSATLSKIEADRLRVVIVFAQPEYLKLVALRADTMGYVSSGWAWVSDGVIGKINFKGDTPDVRAVQLLCFFWCPCVPALATVPASAALRLFSTRLHPSAGHHLLLLCVAGNRNKTRVQRVAVPRAARSRDARRPRVQDRCAQADSIRVRRHSCGGRADRRCSSEVV